MNEWHVRFTDEATRSLERLPASVRRRAFEAIERFEPGVDERNARRLRGYSASWRLRVGDYRLIFEILHGERAVVVHRVQHRRDVYRDR